MKNYIKIQSQGEIEIEAFTLIGASSKRGDDTKIGYFGSGLKYSIAALLRNNIDFKIFQGENEIKFDVVEKEFRGESFNAISVNGKETSMTTTMGGKDWDIPFAPFREIYSNALDEDDDVVLAKTTSISGTKDTTSIFIEMTDAMSDFYKNINEYFCNKNPNVLFSNRYISVYHQASHGGTKLFRKGILCYEDNKPALYSYNSSEFVINESRVLSNEFTAKLSVASGWKICNDESMIMSLIDGLKGGNAGRYEHTLPFHTYVSFSDTWYNVCKNLKFVPAEAVMFCKERQLIGRIVLPKSLLVPLYKQFEDLDVLGLSKKEDGSEYVIEDEPSTILTDKVIDALSLLRKTRYASRLSKIDIHYASFLDKNVLGIAENGKTILSTKLDVEDVSFIAKVIIEENEHNISGYGDETREFQNHLFNLYFDELNSKTK
jgi:hypothetical protein